jgi:ATP-dependent DNA helicase RecG
MLRSTSVSHIAGVGPAKATSLAELGIFSVHDLLHHFPFRFDDRRVQPLASYAHGDKVTVAAMVEGISTIKWQARKSTMTARLLVDGQYRLAGVWFNQHYLKDKLVDGRFLVLSGKLNRERRTITVSNTEFTAHGVTSKRQQWHPVYKSSKTISSTQIAQFVAHALQKYEELIEEVLPYALTKKYRLISHREAVKYMHIPSSPEELRQAHRRLAFEEFFIFQLQLQWFRRQTQKTKTRVARQISRNALTEFSDSLPFAFTSAQTRSCESILADLTSVHSMHRLLQGDVGSGKTWVALFAAFSIWRSGAQSALMAPTEILAEQHLLEAEKRLHPLGMRVGLVTGSTTEKNRKKILEDVENGHIHLLIGTHALLTGDVLFQNLGLVVTDEQHRFGVSQRALLREKGRSPDVLLLSATPIPRTLALAIYGDLDVSVLDELPAGRKPIETSAYSLRQEDRAIRRVRQELAKGRQAYVVAPLIEQSDQLDVISATELFSNLQDQFAGHSVSLLHGRMPSREKDDVMRKFVNGHIQVLVSTTVIEVGINVPNATVMLVYHAERFGLAQLHQLRGRVGRGAEESYCILLSDADNEIAKARLETMVSTSNGFDIAEKDLQLRGPGEFLGVRQSGLPAFTVGDLARDFKVMEVARDEAMAIILQPNFWLEPRYRDLRDLANQQQQSNYFKD